jgi:hypothetical protein
MWLKNFINECKVWREIKKVYKKNEGEFKKLGLKIDWVGRIWKVINRDAKIPLGTPEDEILLRKELNEIQEFLVKQNIIDILAYELIPQEKVTVDENGVETYENGYLIKFTPAYRLDKQYLTVKNVFLLILTTLGLLSGIVITLIRWLA